MQYPVLDGSDIDLESMAPEAVAAWVRKYPEQAWRKAYETAAYMIATGQVQLPQGDAPEPTPEPGEGNTNKPWESPEVSKTYYRTNEQGVQEPIYVPPVESQPKQPEIEKEETPNNDFVVFDGVSLQDVVDFLKKQKLELAQNASEPYPTGEAIDESLKEPYLNIWNPPEAGISPAGLELILKWEDLREYPYNDTEDPETATCTVGYGHALHSGTCSEAEMNTKYDDNQLKDFLVMDLLQAEKNVRTVLQQLDMSTILKLQKEIHSLLHRNNLMR